MATESFKKTFEVNCKSVDSMLKILNSKKTTVINQKKNFIDLPAKDIKALFGKNR